MPLRTLNVPFEDWEFEDLTRSKPQDMNWHDYIIKAINRMNLTDEAAKNLKRRGLKVFMEVKKT